ncbi:unnamed protein product [marine sediment metagenome]|uniref:Uncharacterized protein n=1 Tax=marine sediment metagenome TaxID=412755 RepID=X1BR28_9ZZZZ
MQRASNLTPDQAEGVAEIIDANVRVFNKTHRDALTTDMWIEKVLAKEIGEAKEKALKLEQVSAWHGGHELEGGKFDLAKFARTGTGDSHLASLPI